MPIPKPFSADQFIATDFVTAAEKAKFANHFIRFWHSGFKRSLFYKWFYCRLSLTFGHIANYNIDNFYCLWFDTIYDQERFMRHTALYPPMGAARHTFSDVEQAIIAWLAKEAVERRGDVQQQIFNWESSDVGAKENRHEHVYQSGW